MNFTPHQLEAVDVEREAADTCVVAGPGSGKTTVLVEYFRRLVAAGADPLRILAITFTEKAAANMRQKLAKAFEGDARLRARMERAWVATIHGFCARLLRENALVAGVDPDFQIADERDSSHMRQEALAEAIDEKFDEHPAAVRGLIRGLCSPDFESAVLAAYDAMRCAGVPVGELEEFPASAGVTVDDVAGTLDLLRAEHPTAWNYAQKQQLAAAIEGAERIVAAADPGAALREVAAFSCNLNKCKRGNGAYDLLKLLKQQIGESKRALITEFYAPQRALLVEILRRFDQLYRERKREAGVLDFSDLEEFTVRLLRESAETRAAIQGEFDHVLMDEFQDTNHQQDALMRLVRPSGRFYAVGDINQSIFGFRHADPQGFAQYRDEMAGGGGRIVPLLENFRSRKDVLRAVETIVEGAEGIEPRELVPGRAFESERPVCVELLAAADAQIEARWVARRILDLLAAEPRFTFGKVAVLVRNTEVVPGFTAAFDEAAIPYVVNRGRGFYETREVNDLTALLRTIANPRDEISLAAVLRSPLVGISDEGLARLKMLGPNLRASLMLLDEGACAAFDADDARVLLNFRGRLQSWRVRREYDSFDRLLLAAIDDCGYRADSGARGDANIDKFLAQAREAARRMSLDKFVEELELARAENPREPDAPPEDSTDAVKVMTVHSAKGLEFPVVIVGAMQKGVENDPGVVAFSRVHGLGAKWRNPAERKNKSDLALHAIREERRRREAEESSRLLYVAMTRAEEHLILSFSGKPKEWAAVAARALELEDLESGRAELIQRAAPNGDEWSLRLLVTDRSPELTRAQAARAQGAAPRQADEAFELLGPPAVIDRHDSITTVTALADFTRCPRQYYLRHYQGFQGGAPARGESEGGLSAAEFGTQVHALLAGGTVAAPDAEALRLAAVFRQSALGRRVERAARLEREFDFLMALEDLVIRGQVDLWFEEGGEVAIVDYKTDAVSAAEARGRAQDYALQLRLYALAVERAAGRPPASGCLHFLRPNTIVEVDLHPSLLESPEQMVRDFLDAQSRQEWELNEGAHCHRCPFYHDLCPAG